MAIELNLLRTLRQDTVVLSDCVYILTDQWNQMRLAVAKQSFLFPCNVVRQLFSKSHRALALVI